MARPGDQDRSNPTKTSGREPAIEMGNRSADSIKASNGNRCINRPDIQHEVVHKCWLVGLFAHHRSALRLDNGSESALYGRLNAAFFNNIGARRK
jgi:hypothetical protein